MLPKLTCCRHLQILLVSQPVFNYNHSPIPITSDYDVEPITPARMSGETVSKLYGSYLKLGIGSYITPMQS
jgi:hypothetical protein